MKRIAKLPKPPTATQTKPDGGEEEVPLSGFIPIGDGYYDLSDDAEVDEKDVISEGEDRYRNLPQNDKNKILEALINEPEVDKDGKATGGKKPKRIKMNQIKAGDEVLEANIIPHHWFGESPSAFEPTLPDNTLPPEP